MPEWEALRDRSQGRVATLYADLFLRAAATRLGHEKERAAESTRILQNPVRWRLMLPDNLESYFAALRATSSPTEGFDAGSRSKTKVVLVSL